MDVEPKQESLIDFSLPDKVELLHFVSREGGRSFSYTRIIVIPYDIPVAVFISNLLITSETHRIALDGIVVLVGVPVEELKGVLSVSLRFSHKIPGIRGRRI